MPDAGNMARRAAAHLQRGEWPQAEAVYAELLQILPASAPALFGFGVATARQGRFADAVAPLQEAWQRAARGADRQRAGLFLAECLARSAQHERAESVYLALLEDAPDDIAALYGRARLLTGTGRPEAALAPLRRVSELRPQDTGALGELAAALEDSGARSEAEDVLRRAGRIDPNDPAIHNNLGNLLETRGQLDEAERSYRRAVSLAPSAAAFHLSLCKLLKFEGRFDEALQVMRAGLAAQPDYWRGYAAIAGIDAGTVSDAEIARMKDAIAAGAASGNDEIELQFALAQAFEKREEYDRAFGHYRRGNELARHSIDADVADDEEGFRLAAELHDGPRPDAAGGHPSDAPIFIVGMPRSGSTLVEQILASHPQVAAGGEMPHLESLFVEQAGALDTGRISQALAALSPEAARSLADRYLEDTAELRRHTPHFTDKMLFHFAWLGPIRTLFPNARFVYVRRDAMDNGVACYRQLFAERQRFYFSFSLTDFGRYYRACEALMAHWQACYPGAIFELHYEELVTRPDDSIRALLEYCGLAFDAACLRPHETRRAVTTASATQVRQPIYRSSVGMAERYEAHLEPLREALGLRSS